MARVWQPACNLQPVVADNAQADRGRMQNRPGLWANEKEDGGRPTGDTRHRSRIDCIDSETRQRSISCFRNQKWSLHRKADSRSFAQERTSTSWPVSVPWNHAHFSFTLRTHTVTSLACAGHEDKVVVRHTARTVVAAGTQALCFTSERSSKRRSKTWCSTTCFPRSYASAWSAIRSPSNLPNREGTTIFFVFPSMSHNIGLQVICVVS